MSFLDVATVVIVFIVTDQVTRRLRIFYRRNWPAYKKRRDADKRYKEAFGTVLRILYPEHESERSMGAYDEATLSRAVATLKLMSQNKSIAEYRRNEVASMQNAIDKYLRDWAERVYIARLNQKSVRGWIEDTKKNLDDMTRSQIDLFYQERVKADLTEDAVTKVFWRNHDAAALLGFKTYPDIWAHRVLKV